MEERVDAIVALLLNSGLKVLIIQYGKKKREETIGYISPGHFFSLISCSDYGI